METLADHLDYLWEKSEKSLAELAKKTIKGTRISRQGIWRVIRGNRLPKGSSLSSLLRYGFGLSEDDPDYKKAIDLWTQEQTNPKIRPDYVGSRMQRIHNRLHALTDAELDVIEKILKNRRLFHVVSAVVTADSVES